MMMMGQASIHPLLFLIGVAMHNATACTGHKRKEKKWEKPHTSNSGYDWLKNGEVLGALLEEGWTGRDPFFFFHSPFA